MRQPLRLLRQILLSGSCAVCQRPCSDGMALCHTCYRTLPFLQQHCRCCALPLPMNGICGLCQTIAAQRTLDLAHALLRYDDRTRSLIHRIKYQADFHLLHLLGRALAKRLRAQLADIPLDAVVPIPLHPARLRQRGFNQADRLAALIAQSCALPLHRNYLSRQNNPPSQTGLNRQQRLANMRDCFSLSLRTKPIKRVLLVDDVMTSGATLREAAACCRRHGSVFIAVAMLCRTDLS